MKAAAKHKNVSSKDYKINACLDFISAVLSDLKNQIDSTQSNNELKNKTELWKELEKRIESPLNCLFEIHDSVNENSMKAVEKIVLY